MLTKDQSNALLRMFKQQDDLKKLSNAGLVALANKSISPHIPLKGMADLVLDELFNRLDPDWAKEKKGGEA